MGTETVSFSTGNERSQTYASASAVNSRGIIPNNGYDRYNFTFRNTSSFLRTSSSSTQVPAISSRKTAT